MILYWDIDGTLVDNEPNAGFLYGEALYDIVGLKAVNPPSLHGKVDRQIIREYLDEVGADYSYEDNVSKRLEEIWSNYYYNEKNYREALPGVEEVLLAADSNGFVNALFTGNPQSRAKKKLLGAGLDVEMFNWDASFFGDVFLSRPKMAEAACSKVDSLQTSAVMIGDTPGDGAAALIAGFPFIAICTGEYKEEDLSTYSPIIIFDSLEEKNKVFMETLLNL